jgi:hypothetical protein
MMCTVHEDLCTFFIKRRSVLRMRNASENCIAIQNTLFMFNEASSKIVPFLR